MRSASEPINFLSLPNDILMKILSEVPITTSLSVFQVNTGLHSLCTDPIFWEEKLKFYYPDEYTLFKRRKNTWQFNYFNYFKNCYFQPFFISDGRDWNIIKAEDARSTVLQQLYLRIKEGNCEKVEELIKKDHEVFIIKTSSLAKLFLCNNIQTYKKILNWASTPAQPLLNAAFQEAKLSSNFSDKEMLEYALTLNQVDVVKAILNTNSTDINKAFSNRGETPLYLAAELGHQEIVEFLVKKGANINKASSSGATPLEIAIRRRHLEVAKLLVENGVDINDDDSTPLVLAVTLENQEIVKLLVENGADINKATDRGETPLHCATNLEMVQFLVGGGGKINSTTFDGETSLHRATRCGYLELVQYFVENGADINKSLYRGGETPLYLAAESGHQEIVEFLVEKGADINKASFSGRTPLHCAVQSGHPKIVSYLSHRLYQQKIKQTLTAVLATNMAENATPLTQTITLFDWYTQQKFYKHHFNYKSVASALVTALKELHPNDFTIGKLEELIQNALSEQRATHKQTCFWKGPASYESLNDLDYFKAIERFIIKEINSDTSEKRQVLAPMASAIPSRDSL